MPLSDNLPQIGVSGIAIDPTNSDIIYIATGDKDGSDSYSIGVMKSIDGGLTWNTTGLSFTNTNTFAGDIVINPTNVNELLVATSDGIYKTSNAGATWSQVRTGSFSQGTIRIKPNNPNTVYGFLIIVLFVQLILVQPLLQLHQDCQQIQVECC